MKWLFRPDIKFQQSLLEKMHLTPERFYFCEETPTMFDPRTFQKVEAYFVVRCDDGKLRKLAKRHFISQADLRDGKLGDLGI